MIIKNTNNRIETEVPVTPMYLRNRIFFVKPTIIIIIDIIKIIPIITVKGMRFTNFLL